MASMNAPASIGDVVRALFRLEAANPARAAPVMQALGWRALHAAPAPLPPSPLGKAPRPPRAIETPNVERKVQPSELRPLEVLAEPVDPRRRPTAQPLPLPAREDHRPVFNMPIRPLLEPRLARAVLGRVSAVRLRRGEIDLDAVVATIARGGVLTKFPRRPAPSVASGVQVLVDVAPSMQPFYEDIAELLRALRGAVGAERISVQDFETCPWYGVIDETARLVVPYVPPRAGTPVLAVTDLGLARASAPQRAPRKLAWLHLARRLTILGTPLSLLSPYAEERLNARDVTRSLRLVLWDRGVGVHRVPSAPILRSADD